MPTTSVNLGKHWEEFIRAKVATGRYGSASEVIREALRLMENEDTRLKALRRHLGEGEAEADSGQSVKDFSVDKVIAEADRSS